MYVILHQRGFYSGKIYKGFSLLIANNNLMSLHGQSHFIFSALETAEFTRISLKVQVYSWVCFVGLLCVTLSYHFKLFSLRI